MERWVCDKKHSLSTEDAEWLLDHRACTWLPSAHSNAKEPQDYHFGQTTESLKSSNLWKNKSDISYLKTSQAFDVLIHSVKPNSVG